VLPLFVTIELSVPFIVLVDVFVAVAKQAVFFNTPHTRSMPTSLRMESMFPPVCRTKRGVRHNADKDGG
jgi:hypothetical protein